MAIKPGYVTNFECFHFPGRELDNGDELRKVQQGHRRTEDRRTYSEKKTGEVKTEEHIPEKTGEVKTGEHIQRRQTNMAIKLVFTQLNRKPQITLLQSQKQQIKEQRRLKLKIY